MFAPHIQSAVLSLVKREVCRNYLWQAKTCVCLCACLSLNVCALLRSLQLIHASIYLILGLNHTYKLQKTYVEIWGRNTQPTTVNMEWTLLAEDLSRCLHAIITREGYMRK